MKKMYETEEARLRAMFEQEMAAVAKRRGITATAAKEEYRRFIESHWIFSGKGNIWRQFKTLPTVMEFYRESLIIPLDPQSHAELCAFRYNTTAAQVIRDIEYSVRDAYEHNRDREFWAQFTHCPTFAEVIIPLTQYAKQYNEGLQSKQTAKKDAQKDRP